MRIKWSWLTILLSLLLQGCGPLKDASPLVQAKSIPLASGDTVGQTFVSKYDGLAAIGLVIQADRTILGDLFFTIQDEPGSAVYIRQVHLDVKDIAQSGFTYFYFPQIRNSNQKDFAFSIAYKGEGEVQVGTSSGASYLNGVMYVNGQPEDAQTVFETVYGKRLAFGGLAIEFSSWILWLTGCLYLYILPGWAILSLVYSNWSKLDFWAKFGLSAGVSIGIYPLLLLWSQVIGIQPGMYLAWLTPLFCLIFALILNRKNLRLTNLIDSIKSFFKNPSNLTLLFVGLLIIFSRLWITRSLDLPMWGDSYQHTIITKLIVDNNGLFKNWLPYADLKSFTYHFGFHSLVAVFNWLTQQTIIKSTILVGQFMNILAVLSLYPVTLRLTKNSWAGVFSVLFAGLLFSMPNYYINWGRYTQLSGLILLSACVFLLWDFLGVKKWSWQLAFLCAFLYGALFLTHIRVLLFAVFFIIAYFLFQLRSKNWKQAIYRVSFISIGAIGITLPWLINLVNGKLPAILSYQLKTPPSKLPATVTQAFQLKDLFFYLPLWVWILLPIILGWAIWRRDKNVLLFSTWWFLLIIAANPQWLNLPGAEVINGFTVLISLFYPASILLGSAAGWLVEIAQKRFVGVREKPPSVSQTILPIIIALSIVIAGVFGANARLKELNPVQNSLATRSDMRAAEWIKENTPEDSCFLVNSFFAYGGYAIVGSDGGWWLPLLAKRCSTLPPLPYASETGYRPDYRAWINSLTSMIQELGINNTNVLRELANRKVDYIYVGQQQGMVNTSSPLIKLDDVLSNPIFKPIYHQDRVWIFEIQ